MTWHAQAGQIVLAGGEAKMFRDIILYMCDMIMEAEDDQASCFEGAQVFDRMTRTEQLACLEVVSQYLFHETEACLELSAWSEATLASILHEIRTFIHLEIEEEQGYEYRQTIMGLLDAEKEIEDFDDPEEWEAMLEAYEARFLWDMDYEDDDITDLAPEEASRIRQKLGIEDSYFTALAPDLDKLVGIVPGAKRVWMAIDGKKTIQMTMTLTCAVPTSLAIESVTDDLVAVRGVFPQIMFRQLDPQGNITEASDGMCEFFLHDATEEYSIEDVPEAEL